MPVEHPKDYLQKRMSGMKLERESFIDHWKDISEFVKPRRGRFFLQDRNKGHKKHQSIINSQATQAHKIATSGMLAGTMSPTRPWFALETHNPDLMEAPGVRQWLYMTERILRAILNGSNFYGMASDLISELILFGTGAMSHVDDFDDVARFYTHTIGSYMIAANDRYVIDTFFREFEWTAEQIVKAFGTKNVSRQVKDAIDRGDYNRWFPVAQLVEPNDDFRPSSKLAVNKKFKSIYYEPGNTGEDKGKYLNVSGFDEFPVYVPRWEVTGEDIYGTDCPGMTALGDIKGLQIEERRKAQAIDKMVNPPLTGPASVRNVPINSLPGGLTIYDGDDQRQQLRPIYTVNPQVADLREDIDAVARRIDKAFFVDMFLAISTMEGIQPRNQLDILHRNEERLLQLGPVLERIQSDFLDQLIDRTFNQAVRAGILPEPPPGIGGSPLRVRYVSTLAMAQRAVATQNIERFMGFVGNLAQLGFVNVMDKIDVDQAVDEFGTAMGVPPSLIVPDEDVEKVREARAKQEALAASLQAGTAATNMAKMASDAKTDEPSVLTEQDQNVAG